jgi:hypothetical protein
VVEQSDTPGTGRHLRLTPQGVADAIVCCHPVAVNFGIDFKPVVSLTLNHRLVALNPLGSRVTLSFVPVFDAFALYSAFQNSLLRPVSILF